ncbi:MAG TPA: HupE/UreJ family protein [Candidatus Acidoferrales bacterium]|nr:HupE/UreJ family protein [Candidatus Acidoferrales bacterium]
MNPLALLGLGLVLGIRHASDPDHVVAVAAITARTRRLLPATLLGAVWGLGHSLTLFVVGSAIVAFNLVVPPRLGLSMEFAVALALVVVGSLNLRRGRAHAHDELGGADRLPAARAFVVGLVHGLAGSAAIALLVLATVRTLSLALAYLGTFAIGTLIGMALITTGFALPLSAGTRRWPRFATSLRIATGLLSVGFGLWLVWQIGFVDGLFRAHPNWIPS